MKLWSTKQGPLAYFGIHRETHCSYRFVEETVIRVLVLLIWTVIEAVTEGPETRVEVGKI